MENAEGSKFLPSFLCCNNQLVLEESVEETQNGLHLNNIYVPEEIILHILTFVDPKELLKCSLVCRNWNRFVKSYALWSTLYKHKYHNKPKQLPWYLFYCLLTSNYFNNNLLKNGNGQDNFKDWQILANGGHRYIIENPPEGADPLPLDMPEFCNQTSCFATSFGKCHKIQNIPLGKSELFRYVMNTYKPYIYLGEWTAGRFDCGSIYKLRCGFITNYQAHEVSAIYPCVINRVKQWEGSKWKKIEMTITEYPDDIEGLIFDHEGCDTQYWAGHYGSKMAGGVVKVLFDSIEPLPLDENGKEKPKGFSEIKYDTNGEKETSVPDDVYVYYDNGIVIYSDDNYSDYDDEDEEYIMQPAD